MKLTKKEFIKLVALDEKKLKDKIGYIYFYDKTTISDPFMVKFTNNCIEELRGNWQFIEGNDFEIIQEWYENIPEQGILCWVWEHDDNSDKYQHLAIVIKHKQNFFIIKNKTSWHYAEPCTLKEIKQFLLEEV